MATGSDCTTILKDVVAFVDVWSSNKTENYSKPFIQQLQEMGAQVSKTFHKQVTHVVFKNGHQATWNKAKKLGVKLVSVLWVDRCMDDAEHVDEELCPAINDERCSALKKRTHRCMQPRDTPDGKPGNDRRMRKKLDKMIKDIAPKSPLITDVSPYIIDEENGIVYSPSLKRSDSMAQRLKEMRERRENLSPTASQMVESNPSPEMKPSLGTTPTMLKLFDEQSGDESSASFVAESSEKMLPHLTHSSDEREEGQQHGDLDRKDSEKPWLSPCRDVSKRKSIIHHFKFPDLEKGAQQNTKSRRSSVKRDPIKKKSSLDTLESHCQDNGSEDTKSCHQNKRQSQSKFHSSMVEKSEQSANKLKKGKCKTRAVQSRTDNKTSIDPEVSNSPSCLFGKAPVNKKLAKGNISALQIVDRQTPKQKRPSISALVRSITHSSESLNVASSSIDEDDGVFEDYFSPANHHQRQQGPLLPSLPLETKIQIPFEMGSIKGKRKQRNSGTGSESAHTKKRKQGKSPQNTSHQSDGIRSEPQKHPHRDVQQSPPSVDAACISVAPMTRERSGPRTLPLTDTGEFATEAAKQTSTSIPIQLATLDFRGASAAFDHQKNSDVNVRSHSTESRGSEHTVAAGLTETISEGIQSQNEQVHLMGRKTKTMRTLVMTSMPTDKQHTVTQVVGALGGFSIVDRVCESTTHVVSGGHRRTLNILLGIARGCWILSFEWILWCLDQRQWIPEEPYELSDHFPAAAICRLQQHLSAGEHQQDLFQGLPAMFVSQHSQPPTQSLLELIQLCGGTVCKTVRQAGICIGKYNGRRPEGSKILSEQWVLDCITHLKQLSYENYNLE